MRVGSISCVNYLPRSVKSYSANSRRECSSHSDYLVSEKSKLNFKGKFGQAVGGTIGTGLVIAASIIALPAVAPAAGIGLLFGMVGGDIAEDYVNKEGSEDEPKDNKTK